MKVKYKISNILTCHVPVLKNTIQYFRELHDYINLFKAQLLTNGFRMYFMVELCAHNDNVPFQSTYIVGTPNKNCFSLSCAINSVEFVLFALFFFLTSHNFN